MIRDLKAIAHDGYLATDQPLSSRAHMGWLTAIVAFVISAPELRKGGGMLIKTEKRSKKEALRQDDRDMLLIIRIFLKIWD